MKRNKATRRFIILIVSCLLFPTVLFAQNTVTKSIPGDYATIFKAIEGEKANLSSGDKLIIQLPEGTHIETDVRKTPDWGKALEIVIQGAGANKSILSSPLGELPNINGGNGDRMWNLNNLSSIEGSTLIFKDLTAKYWGITSGGHSAGVFVNFNGDFTISAKFINVVFDSCLGRSIINTWTANKSSFEFDNCLFINCVTTVKTDDGQSQTGIISRQGWGNLIVKNTTFHSNKVKHISTASEAFISTFHGSAISITAAPGQSADIVLENNAFVNNTTIAEADHDSLSALISFRSNETTTAFNVKMTNNIMIGNNRSGKIYDVDVFVADEYKKIIFNETSSGNILNSAVNLINTGEGETRVISFANLQIPGSKISPLYTYTHDNIDFTMEGDKPKLTPDENGVGKVDYKGDGGALSAQLHNSRDLRIYPLRNMLRIEGLNHNDKVEVYTITGSLFKQARATGNSLDIQMPKGLFIIRTDYYTQKVLVF